MNPSHYDLLVLLVVAAVVHLGGLMFLGWVAWKATVMHAESQRLTRAVGALIVQESDKIRALLADSRG